jgi:DNA-binding transcriptional LysR family regulator
MGSFPTAGAVLVPRALAALSVRRPQVEILLDEGEPDVLVPRLLDGDLDVVLCYEYRVVPRSWPAGVVRHLVMGEDLVLLAPSLPGWADRLEDGLSAYARATWVSSALGTAGAACLERLCAAEGFSPRVAFRSNNYDTVTGIVGAGLGVALVPGLGYRSTRSVVGRRLDADQASRGVFAMHRAGNTSPLVALAVAALQQAAPAGASNA